MLDHHHGRVGHIHTDFDDGGRDQNLQLASLKHAHDLVFQIGVEAAVQKSHFQIGENLAAELAVHLDRGLEFALFILCDHRIDHVGLVPGSYLFSDELPHFRRLVVSDAAGRDRRASGRQFVEHAEIEIAVERERKRARNGRRGHDQNIRLGGRRRSTISL